MSARSATLSRASTTLLMEQGHTRATSIQFEKRKFQLSYFRKDLEESFSEFFVDMVTPSIRSTTIVTLGILLIRHLVMLLIFLLDPSRPPPSQNALIGYGIVGLALSIIICATSLTFLHFRSIFARFHHIINPITFLLLGIFPIITANIFDGTILSHASVIELTLLLLAYGPFTQIRFVHSIPCGWLLFIYQVAALGVASRQSDPPLSLAAVLSLVLYSALAVFLFNVAAYKQEKYLRSTFEVYYIKKQQTDQLMVEINDLRKRNNAESGASPPEAPLTKALKMLQDMESRGMESVPINLSQKLKEVMNILSSGRLYSPNVRKAVGDEEIGAWLDHMLGEQKPEATIRPDSHFRQRTPIAELDRRERAGSTSSKVNPFVEGAQKCFSSIPPEVRVTLNEVLSFKGSWDFDVFKLTELTNGHPLLFLAHYIFSEENFLFEFKISEDAFIGYANAIESGYRSENPYHNSIHGADVLHATYYFIKNSVKKDSLSNLEIVAALIAAMVHDYAHPGVNNNFLIKIEHPLALRYNDRSVLENYHASEALRLMKAPELNICSGMNPNEVQHFKSLVMDLVLGTDVSHHFEYMSKFENRMSGGLTIDRVEKKEDIVLLLTYIVKCADMSNPSRPAEINRKWVERVMEEFFNQGDLEREKGLDISMFYDRQKPNTAKCQTGFIDFLVRPMYQKWHNFTQSEATKLTIECLESNYQFWKANLEVQNNQNNPLNAPQTAKNALTVKKSALALNSIGRFSGDDLPLTPIRN